MKFGKFILGITVTFILILGGIFISIFPTEHDEKMRQMYADLNYIEMALNDYYEHNETYPNLEQGLEILIRHRNDDDAGNENDVKYFNEYPIDPWGEKYRYATSLKAGKIVPFVVSSMDQKIELSYAKEL